MSALERNLGCSEVGPLLVFLACDEVTREERAAIEKHLAACSECRSQLAEEGQFRDNLSLLPQAADELDGTGTLLAQCRSELSESLDGIAAPAEPRAWHPFGLVRRWMALRPGWSAAGLLAAGAVLGVQLLQWLPADDGRLRTGTVSVSAASQMTDEKLAKMAVANINFAPNLDAAPGTLQVQLRTEQPEVLSGSLDDTDVRRVLTYVVRNSDRFDAGVRLDCLEALKTRITDSEIRDALLDAARHDKNPAVRMKALESLRDVASDEEVRDAVLEALDSDSNPGVRVEAINLLVRSLELESAREAPPTPGQAAPEVPFAGQLAPVPVAMSDPSVQRVLRALEELQHRDPNRYVRLRSAAALRQISTRDIQ